MKRIGVVRDLLKTMLVIAGAVHRRRASLVALVACCVMALAACDESLIVGTPGPNGSAQVLAVTPTQLLAQFGVQLDTPIRVRVLDASGRPVRSAAVHYSVVTGAGIFSADSTITNDQGFTEVTFRPLTAGNVIVQAMVHHMTGPQQVMFTILVLNDPTIATSFVKVSGDTQAGSVGTSLPLPFVVRLQNGDGFPVANVPVTFALQVARADSAGVAAARGGPYSGQVTVMSDSGGFARAFGRLGTEVGAYGFTASAVIETNGVKQTQTLSFSATATPSTRVATLIPISGANQTVVIDTLHEREDTLNFRGRDPRPMVVQALDRFGNPVVNATITWFVSDGDGKLLFSTTTTDANGLSSNLLEEVSEGNNAVVAFALGADPVEFVITAALYEPPADPNAGGGGGGGGG